MRGIELFHVREMGWKDIGYNALVDRFGTIYEGQRGGLERAVVGAHARGFNYGSFGVSLIGNYMHVQPPAAAHSARAAARLAARASTGLEPGSHGAISRVAPARSSRRAASSRSRSSPGTATPTSPSVQATPSTPSCPPSGPTWPGAWAAAPPASRPRSPRAPPPSVPTATACSTPSTSASPSPPRPSWQLVVPRRRRPGRRVVERQRPDLHGHTGTARPTVSRCRTARTPPS